MKRIAPALLAAVLALPLFVSPTRARAQDVNSLKAGVVRIQSTRSGEVEVGTGFIVKVDGRDVYIVTAAHVVRGDSSPRVYLSNQAREPIPSQILDMEEDDRKGLALLLLKADARAASGLTALPLGLTSQLGGGESAKVIGFPGGIDSMTVGAGNIERRDGRNLVLSGAIRSGNSGGPVILDGYVVGLVTDTKEADAYAACAETVVLYANGIEARLKLTLASPAPPPKERATYKLTLDKIEAREDGSGGRTQWDFAVQVGTKRLIQVPPRDYTNHGEQKVIAINESAEVDVTKGEQFYIDVIGTKIAAQDTRALGGNAVLWEEVERAPRNVTAGGPTLSFQIPVKVEKRPKSGYFIAYLTITKLTSSEQPAKPIEVSSPVEGKEVSRGELTIRATVKDMRLDEYRLFVVVNGGLPTEMPNSSESYPHKEAVVDISGLPAQAGGSVQLNFVAKDPGGKVIATKALKVSLKP